MRTAQQKTEYRQYVKACREQNIEPTVADFLGVELSWEEINDKPHRVMSWRYLLRKVRLQAPLAMSASA
jgi:hypothetical protein